MLDLGIRHEDAIEMRALEVLQEEEMAMRQAKEELKARGAFRG